MADIKCELYHDNLQNHRRYNLPPAQLIVADIPYNIGTDFYASRPDWYVDGDNQNGESRKSSIQHGFYVQYCGIHALFLTIAQK